MTLGRPKASYAYLIACLAAGSSATCIPCSIKHRQCAAYLFASPGAGSSADSIAATVRHDGAGAAPLPRAHKLILHEAVEGVGVEGQVVQGGVEDGAGQLGGRLEEAASEHEDAQQARPRCDPHEVVGHQGGNGHHHALHLHAHCFLNNNGDQNQFRV